MLRISKKMMFALEAVVDIAFNAGPDPVQSKDITERQGIPQRYLEQVMQRMVRAGILRGVRGPRGGYRLARERRRITVGEVARVVYALEDGDEPDYPGSSAIGDKVVAPMWRELQAETMARLDAITLEDLCRQARENGIERADTGRPDFTI